MDNMYIAHDRHDISYTSFVLEYGKQVYKVYIITKHMLIEIYLEHYYLLNL